MKTKVLYSRTAYGSDKPWMNKTKTGPFIYPAIMNVGKNNNITKLWWSNTKDNGHFGIPKIVFGFLSYGVFIDWDGEYGLTQGGGAIVDDPKNLENIARAMKTEKFIDIVKKCNVGGLLAQGYNYRIIKELRHDFWRDFIETN